ncbi:MAG: glycosyltransferase family 2 protein [Ruminococcus sp.]|nr:glycosyltransferase family 2 protein [Ruminococcus sp.]
MKDKSSPLVSIIIPCYNGHKTLHRCLDSVLEQTYKNLEVITVNDGSTDNTEEIILSYKDRFQNEGMSLVYVFQENTGLGGAINAGLKVFSGDYLCWIDCDDFMYPESVKIRLTYLEEHPEYGVATSDAYSFNESDLNTPVSLISKNTEDTTNPNQFLLHLRGKSIFCSGCHMIRSTAFLDMTPSRQIYPARRGQNWQMLLPVYYKYKRVFIPEPLYGYITYENSMSGGDVTKDKKIFRFNEHLEIISHTLNAIPMPDKERKKYLRIYKGIHARQMYGLGASTRDYKMALIHFIRLIFLGEFSSSDIKQILNHYNKKNKE